MIQAWIDVETTGIDPAVSGAFEIAILIFKKGKFLDEKVFHLNPLNETIQFGEKAYRINGVSEETIRSYLPADKVMPEIAAWLTPWLFPEMNDSTAPNEKFVFVGYVANFDYRHLKALFDRHDISMDYFFDSRIIDVYELVKKAYARGIIKCIPDKKLETITKALDIPHNEAHSALSDIWATRKLYETIRAMERKMQ
jgi:DNA polymerase III epsilon subunit-like protein